MNHLMRFEVAVFSVDHVNSPAAQNPWMDSAWIQNVELHRLHVGISFDPAVTIARRQRVDDQHTPEFERGQFVPPCPLPDQMPRRMTGRTFVAGLDVERRLANVVGNELDTAFVRRHLERRVSRDRHSTGCDGQRHAAERRPGADVIASDLCSSRHCAFED